MNRTDFWLVAKATHSHALEGEYKGIKLGERLSPVAFDGRTEYLRADRGPALRFIDLVEEG